MADAKAESNVRKIIDDAKNSHEKFTFENKSYEVIQNHKPSRETKTDFYLVARGLDDSKERIFKISYKKPSFSFVENKVKPYRIPFIYGKDWSRILQEQTGSIQDAFNKSLIIINDKIDSVNDEVKAKLNSIFSCIAGSYYSTSSIIIYLLKRYLYCSIFERYNCSIIELQL